jgi:hypothetical protein
MQRRDTCAPNGLNSNFAAAADEETATADQGNVEAHDSEGSEADADVGSATAAPDDEDVEAVIDP